MIFITSNHFKFSQVQQFFPEVMQANIDLDEIQSLDPREIIHHKLKEAQKEVLEGEILVEDTCLRVESLGGLPGPFIKYFLQALDHTTI